MNGLTAHWRSLAAYLIAAIGIGATWWTVSRLDTRPVLKITRPVPIAHEAPPAPQVALRSSVEVGELQRAFEDGFIVPKSSGSLDTATRKELAEKAAELLDVHLGGSLEEYREYMQRHGRMYEPMFQWDAARVASDWETRSRTFRDARVDLPGIEWRLRVLNGEELSLNDRPSIIVDPMAGSGVTPVGSKRATVYELVVPMELADIDGNRRSARLGIWFGRQGGGGWKYSRYAVYGLPPGQGVYLPPF